MCGAIYKCHVILLQARREMLLMKYVYCMNNVEHEGKSMIAPGTENLKITAAGEETNPQ